MLTHWVEGDGDGRPGQVSRHGSAAACGGAGRDRTAPKTPRRSGAAFHERASSRAPNSVAENRNPCMRGRWGPSSRQPLRTDTPMTASRNRSTGPLYDRTGGSSTSRVRGPFVLSKAARVSRICAPDAGRGSRSTFPLIFERGCWLRYLCLSRRPLASSRGPSARHARAAPARRRECLAADPATRQNARPPTADRRDRGRPRAERKLSQLPH
jgi:hypothetical protein